MLFIIHKNKKIDKAFSYIYLVDFVLYNIVDKVILILKVFLNCNLDLLLKFHKVENMINIIFL